MTQDNLRVRTAMEHVTGTLIAETTVQQVTIDDILDAKTAEQIENFNIDINE